MRVLGFGTYAAERHPRIGILLDGLREHRVDVIEANVPLGISTADRIKMVERPWLAYRLLLRLLRCWIALVVAATRARRRGRIDALVVGYLGQFDVLLARVLFPRTLIVLDQLVFGADTAADRGLGSTGGLRRRLLRALDAAAVRAADLVVVDTIEHLDLLPAGRRHTGVVVAVGAPAPWLQAGARRPEAASAGPLRVIFFGLFTPLQGAEVIGAALAALTDRPDIEVTMIGNGQQHDRARELATANASVHWVDWVAARELPAVVADADVCLGIFGTGAKAQRVVPNKVFQGAAAGAAIVTSDTAPQRRCLGTAAHYVSPGDPAALAAALLQLADDRAEVSRLGTAARTLALESFTATAVVAPLVERMKEHA